MNRRDLLLAVGAGSLAAASGMTQAAPVRLQPWTVLQGESPQWRVGAEVYCENGHYAFTVGPVNHQTGWPTLLNAAGEDVTGKYVGAFMPLRCEECGAITMQTVGW